MSLSRRVCLDIVTPLQFLIKMRYSIIKWKRSLYLLTKFILQCGRCEEINFLLKARIVSKIWKLAEMRPSSPLTFLQAILPILWTRGPGQMITVISEVAVHDYMSWKKLSLSSELVMPSLQRLFYLWNMADDIKTFLGPVQLKHNNLGLFAHEIYFHRSPSD